MGVISWRMKKFWDAEMAPHWMKIDGKIGCAFSSAGGWGGGIPSLKLAERRPPHGEG